MRSLAHLDFNELNCSRTSIGFENMAEKALGFRHDADTFAQGKNTHNDIGSRRSESAVVMALRRLMASSNLAAASSPIRCVLSISKTLGFVVTMRCC